MPCGAPCCGDAQPKRPLTSRQRLHLSALEKWRLYGRFPWKLAIATALTLAATVRIVLLSAQDAQAFLGLRLAMLGAVLPDADPVTWTSTFQDVNSTESSVHTALEGWADLQPGAVDAFVVSGPARVEVQAVAPGCSRAACLRDDSCDWDACVAAATTHALEVEAGGALAPVDWAAALSVRADLPVRSLIAGGLFAQCAEWVIRVDWVVEHGGCTARAVPGVDRYCDAAGSDPGAVFFQRYGWLDAVIVALALVYCWLLLRRAARQTRTFLRVRSWAARFRSGQAGKGVARSLSRRSVQWKGVVRARGVLKRAVSRRREAAGDERVAAEAGGSVSDGLGAVGEPLGDGGSGEALLPDFTAAGPAALPDEGSGAFGSGDGSDDARPKPAEAAAAGPVGDVMRAASAAATLRGGPGTGWPHAVVRAGAAAEADAGGGSAAPLDVVGRARPHVSFSPGPAAGEDGGGAQGAGGGGPGRQGAASEGCAGGEGGKAAQDDEEDEDDEEDDGETHVEVPGCLACVRAVSLGWTAAAASGAALAGLSSVLTVSHGGARLPGPNAHGLMLGGSAFLLWLSALRYLEFSRATYGIVLTLQRAAPRVAVFVLGCLPLLLAYASFGVAVFGDTVEHFSGLREACVTLFSVLNGDVILDTFTELVGAFPLVGQVYMYSFVSLFIYVVLNILIALVEEAHFQSSAETASILERQRAKQRLSHRMPAGGAAPGDGDVDLDAVDVLSEAPRDDLDALQSMTSSRGDAWRLALRLKEWDEVAGRGDDEEGGR